MKSSLTIVFLCAAIVLSAITSFAQPETLWTRIYGGNSDEYAFAVQQTADGGYAVTGKTQSFGAGDTDFYLVKTNPLGDSLWTRTYGGAYHDEAWSVEQTTDGGYILAGWTDDTSGAGYADFYLVKTGSSGNQLWSRTYGGSSEDRATVAHQTADGGYIVAGYTQCFGAGYYDFYLIKTNSTGDTLWTRTYGGTEGEFAYSLQKTDDGGYIIAGLTNSFGAGFNDFYLVKTNSSGDTLWTRTYGGTGYEVAYSVQQTDDGGYIVAGETKSSVAAYADFYLVKINGSGDQTWTRTYGGSNRDWAHSVQQTADGGYIVAGMSQSFGENWGQFYLVKANSQGDSLWSCTYGGIDWDEAYSVQQTADGGYIVGGWTDSFAANGYKDFYLVKTGPDPASADDQVVLHPSSFSLSSYPNPFNPSTTVRFSVPKTARVSLSVYDVLGRHVTTLADGLYNTGSHELQWNCSEYPTGVYILQMNSEGSLQTRKMLLMK